MKTSLDYLFRVEAPWIYVGPGEATRKRWMPTRFYSHTGLDVCVRQLRGWKMRTVQALMDEFGAALQFFAGFGENWAALEECLGYLDEWMRADAYVLVVEGAESLLADEHAEQIKTLLRVLNSVGESWSKPIVDNGRFNREPVPFHTLLHVSDGRSDDLARMLQNARDAKVAVRTNLDPENLGQS